MHETTHYHMRDQVNDRVRTLMGERWLPRPSTALWTLIAVVSVLSIVGTIDSVQTLESLAMR